MFKNFRGFHLVEEMQKLRHSIKFNPAKIKRKTTGLLLMTNDGDLARKLTLPTNKIPRTYIARVGGTKQNFDIARRGATVDGIHYRPMEITEISPGKMRVVVTEGKKNEIRIVLRACGAPVQKLHRESFGNLKLGNFSSLSILIILSFR